MSVKRVIGLTASFLVLYTALETYRTGGTYASGVRVEYKKPGFVEGCIVMAKDKIREIHETYSVK